MAALSSNTVRQPLASRSRRQAAQRSPEGTKLPGAQDDVDHVFDLIDTNGDGVITREEMMAALGSDRVFDLIDMNGDGVITRERMMAALSSNEIRLPLASQSRQQAAQRLPGGTHLPRDSASEV